MSVSLCMLPTDLATAETIAPLVGLPSSDPALPLLISAASLSVASYVGHPLHRRTETHHVACAGGPYLWAPVGLLVEVLALSIDGAHRDPATYAIDDSKLGRIRAVGSAFPRTSYQSVSPAPVAVLARPAIALQATYGFTTPAQATQEQPANVPADLVVACALVVGELRSLQAQGSNIASLSLGGASVSFTADRRAISPAVQALLTPYRTSRSLLGGSA